MWLLLDHGALAEFLTEEQNEVYDCYKQEQLTVRQKSVQAKEKLTEIFNSRIWMGHIPEMAELWSQVPEPLKTEMDFQHALSDAKIQAIKQLNKRKAILTK